MKIHKDRKTGEWLLTAPEGVLYQGRRSPWDHPEIIREARRERSRAAPRRASR
jgi:hypothetical protein